MLLLCRSPVRKASGFPATLSIPSAARLSLAAMFFPLTGQASLTALGGGKAAKFEICNFHFSICNGFGFGRATIFSLFPRSLYSTSSMML